MQNYQHPIFLLAGLLLLWGCQATATPAAVETSAPQTPQPVETAPPAPTQTNTAAPTVLPSQTTPPPATPTETTAPSNTAGPALADIISVEASGSPGSYTFSVGIASPDTGCQQYADWWEILTENGELIYRRVLLHSHVSEQPFVRSGGPVAIANSQTVWVRAHMNPGGYGGTAFKGSVATGFEPAELAAGFAPNAATLEPLPNGCAF